MIKQKGISLIELIIFIVVLGILGSSLLMAFVVSLERIPDINRISRATEIAAARMEFIIGQLEKDFSITTDPCEQDPLPISLTEICRVPNGYQIDPLSIIINVFDLNIKFITVIVRDSNDSRILASLNKTVANY